MKRITEITRRDIFDVIRGGYWLPDSIDLVRITWNGRLDEVSFLKRIFDLKSLPSNDRRFENAEIDITVHRVHNSDWEDDWVLDDTRLELVNGEDELFLNFLCQMFHPIVRIEHQAWEVFLLVFNKLLEPDGYEIYETSAISGRAVYGWRDTYSKNYIVEQQAQNLAEKFNSKYMADQISNMNNMVEMSAYDAIGKAKELLESCCKTILIENGITVISEWDVARLTKETCKVLKLTPNDISDTAKASETIRKLLGNLSVISQSMAELRNSYGSGHGKDAKFKGLSPRHARLAVGASVTAVYFIWETYEEQQNRDC